VTAAAFQLQRRSASLVLIIHATGASEISPTRIDISHVRCCIAVDSSVAARIWTSRLESTRLDSTGPAIPGVGDLPPANIAQGHTAMMFSIVLRTGTRHSGVGLSCCGQSYAKLHRRHVSVRHEGHLRTDNWKLAVNSPKSRSLLGQADATDTR